MEHESKYCSSDENFYPFGFYRVLEDARRGLIDPDEALKILSAWAIRYLGSEANLMENEVSRLAQEVSID